MESISDFIESYLKETLDSSGTIEIKRGQLANVFKCVPSQINYVISTRFTLERGYFVESRRGEGGYVRIHKVNFLNSKRFYGELLEHIGNALAQIPAEHLLERLEEEKILTKREALLLKRIVARETLKLPVKTRDEVRAKILKTVLMTLFSEEGE